MSHVILDITSFLTLLNGIRSVYDMAMWTYLLAFAHFMSEVLIFRTAKVSGPTIAPFIVACKYLSNS